MHLERFHPDFRDDLIPIWFPSMSMFAFSSLIPPRGYASWLHSTSPYYLHICPWYGRGGLHSYFGRNYHHLCWVNISQGRDSSSLYSPPFHLGIVISPLLSNGVYLDQLQPLSCCTVVLVVNIMLKAHNVQLLLYVLQYIMITLMYIGICPPVLRLRLDIYYWSPFANWWLHLLDHRSQLGQSSFVMFWRLLR